MQDVYIKLVIGITVARLWRNLTINLRQDSEDSRSHIRYFVEENLLIFKLFSSVRQ